MGAEGGGLGESGRWGGIGGELKKIFGGGGGWEGSVLLGCSTTGFRTRERIAFFCFLDDREEKRRSRVLKVLGGKQGHKQREKNVRGDRGRWAVKEKKHSITN